MRLSERTVLVTGASRGLGRAVAEAAAARGARVACVARDAAALREVTAAIEAAGGSARAFPADLARLDDLPSLWREVREALGPVDVLLCNAAATSVGEVGELALADYEADLRTNFLSPVRLAQLGLADMRARGGGTLAFVVSGAARRPLPAWTSYSATKAALLAFADGLRVELADEPVRVLTVFPGTLDTGFTDRMRIVGRPRVLAGGRPGSPEQVAERIVRALETGDERLTVRGAAWLVGHVDPHAPSWVDRLLARAYRRAPRAGRDADEV